MTINPLNASHSDAIGKLKVSPSPSKLTASPSPSNFDIHTEKDAADIDEDDNSPWCLICLSSPIVDRTVLPACSHAQFCFQCLLKWADVKRKCPLCQAAIGSYVIHSISGNDQDYIRYHLRPQPDTVQNRHEASSSSSLSRRAVVERVQAARQRRRLHSYTQTATGGREDKTSELEAALMFRRSIYSPRHLFAKHVGANRFTNYKHCPTAASINQSLASEPNGKLHRRMSAFVRRELQIWPNVDYEFLTTYVLALTRVLPIGSDESVNLLAEFLGHDNAIHFWHELECFLRSGKVELRNYDRSPLLQYEPLSDQRHQHA